MEMEPRHFLFINLGYKLGLGNYLFYVDNRFMYLIKQTKLDLGQIKIHAPELPDTNYVRFLQL